MEDSGFIGDPRRIRLLPGVPAALVALAEAGYERIVVTNQSGVARGMFGEPDVEKVHRELARLLALRGAAIEAFYYCSHLDETCDCRKPAPGMIWRAVEERGLDLAHSVVFGDRASDIELAHNAGIPGILVGGADAGGGPAPLLVAPDFADGVRRFLESPRA